MKDSRTMRMTHSFTDDSATIRSEGLASPVRMLHLTDTHMQFYDERDGENYEAGVDYCQRYAKMNEEQGTSYVPGDAFRQTMAQAATENLELLTLTGDIIHFPVEFRHRSEIIEMSLYLTQLASKRKLASRQDEEGVCTYSFASV